MKSHQYIWQRPNWTHFTWRSDEVLDLLGKSRLLQGRLLGKVVDQGLTLDPQAHAEVLAEETMKTSAIEGEKLDTRSVRSSVARKLGLPSAGLPIDRYVDGLVAVLLDATQNHNLPLNVERLCGWQAELFPTGYSGMHKIQVGVWRGDEPMQVVSGPPGKEKIHFEAPPSNKIDDEIALFLSWWNTSKSKMEGLIRASIAHFWFVTIHPFEDGNGRIARALTDMALAQDDGQKYHYYSLSSQIMEDRSAYYEILEKCQKGGSDITDWIVWFLGCFSRAIERSEIILSGVFTKAVFWRTHAQAPLNERQRKVINKLFDVGRDAFEGGLTTRKYSAMTGVSKITAFRELNRLLELGLIKQNPGKGRSVSYDLIWPHTP